MVTKLGPLCKVKFLKDKGDRLVVRTEKAGVGGSTPSLGHYVFNNILVFVKLEDDALIAGKLP
jgi:hypothetical protein